jgi:surface antigen
MKKIAVLVCLLTLGLAGCEGTGNKQGIGALTGAVAGGILGNQVGSGGGQIAATAVGALVGGLIGSEIGRSLDEADEQRLYEAQYYALEEGRSGVRTEWDNPDTGHYGYVVPGPAYTVNQLNCRDYTHTVYIDGRPETLRGTACREPDGTWQPVS